jgi:PAS domain S-box-containing protein
MLNCRTILIVDDSESDRLLCRRYLESDPDHSYRILEAETINQGLALWRSQNPDVTLIDLSLTDGNGLILLEAIQEDIQGNASEQVLDLKLPVIVLTGNEDARSAVTALRLGAYDYLIKNDITKFSLQKSVHTVFEHFGLIRKLEQSRKREELISQTALKIRQFINLEDICQTVVQEISQFLQTDRTVIYKFYENMSRRIIAEAVVSPWQSCSYALSDERCLYPSESQVNAYLDGQMLVNSDIYQSNLSECHVQMLESFQVRANVVVPILLAEQLSDNPDSNHQNNQTLWGLLIVHQCSAPRDWGECEIKLLQPLSVQLGIAIQQAEIYQNLQNLNNSLVRQVQERTSELQANEHKLRSILNAIPDVINLISIDGVYLESNPSKASYDLIPKHINPLGKKLGDLLAPDIAENQIQAIQNAISSGEMQTLEQTHLVNDDLHYEEVRVAPVSIDAAVVVVRDISDRRRVEASLRASEEKFQKIALSSPGTIQIFVQPVDGSAYFEYLSSGFEEVNELTVEQVIQNPHLCFEQVHPDDLANLWEAIGFSLETLSILQHEWRIVTPSGKVKWLRSNLRPERRANGDVAWYGVASDISDRKRAEERIQLQYQRAELLTEIAFKIRQSFDIEDILETTVTEIQKLLKVDRALVLKIQSDRSKIAIKEAINDNCTSIIKAFSNKPCPCLSDEEFEIYSNGMLSQIDDIDLADISDLHAEYLHQFEIKADVVVPILQGENLWGLLIVNQCDRPRQWTNFETELLLQLASQLAIAIQQVTTYQKLEQELAEHKQTSIALAQAKELAEVANNAKSDFLANMSHEIRTPMNGVLGMAQILAATPLRDDQKDFVKVILDSGDALLTIINDILDFSKIESGNLELEQKEFNLENTINSVCNLLSKQALDKNINLQCHINNPSPITVIGDSSRLRQILINLIGNAIKFTQQGNISISFNRKFIGSNIYEFRFAIADSGVGIDGDHIDKLFKPFTQADASINRQFGGTGLGLAICKRLVELMGGTIWVESRGNIGGEPPSDWALSHSDDNNQGSTFHFSIVLPSVDKSTPPPKVVNNIAQPLPNEISFEQFPIKILIVEDNIFNQKIAFLMLKKLGCQAEVVNNGSECVNIIFDQESNLAFDLIFMDVQMPVMDGLTATRRIRNLSSSPTYPWIVALTANILPEDRQACFDSGMNDYISKPIHIKEIERSLSAYIKANRFL